MKTFTVYKHPFPDRRVKFFDRYMKAETWQDAERQLKPNETIGGEHVTTIPLKDEQQK